MESPQAKQAAQAAKNNRNLYIGLGAAGIIGYYLYKKKQGDVRNVGDAVSKTGAAVGRGVEKVGVEEGKGLQAKYQK